LTVYCKCATPLEIISTKTILDQSGSVFHFLGYFARVSHGNARWLGDHIRFRQRQFRIGDHQEMVRKRGSGGRGERKRGRGACLGVRAPAIVSSVGGALLPAVGHGGSEREESCTQHRAAKEVEQATGFSCDRQSVAADFPPPCWC